jgi:hypothetical protein
LLSGVTSIAVAAACSGSDAGDPSAAPPMMPTSPPADPPSPPAMEGGALDATTPHTASFAFRPSWKGVTSVEVYGAFGQATDWKSPFLTLTDAGDGTFRGASGAIASGQYAYVFKITGDDAAMPTTLARYGIDPANSSFVACPAEAPTYSKTVSNPCSLLSVPQAAPAATAHVRGHVVSSGTPIAGYLALIEREEPKSHHMFVDRTTTKADGSFDLVVAIGTYRVQVLHPTFYSKTDAQRTSPETFAAVRRTISTPILVGKDVTLDPAEVAYGGYAAMQPRGSTALPTMFMFAVPAGTKVRAAVYGPTNDVGDPFWAAPFGDATSDTFDGDFDTSAAKDAGIDGGARYFWGTEQQYAKPDGGVVSWTAQSMVFPIQWP